jgi:hypothetical protein
MKHRLVILLIWTILSVTGSLVPQINAQDHASMSVVRRQSTSTKRGLAALAVARAALQIADERPSLPDSRSRLTGVAPDQHRTAGDTGRMDAQGTTSVPPRIEFSKAVVLAEPPLPAQLVVGHWAHGCAAGERQVRDLRRVLVPRGWTIGSSINDQIQLIHSSPNEPCPRLTLYQNGVPRKTWEGYQDPVFLSHELRRAWDSAPTPEFNVATAGQAGTIHARPQIHGVLAWWAKSLGAGTKVSVNWDRTGAQTFPLLAKGDWSVGALFGKSGRFQISVTGSKLIPVDSLGFGYRIINKDLSIDLDPVLFKQFERRLNLVNETTYGSEEWQQDRVSRLSFITAWTVASVIRDIISLLNPTCDLQLGGNVSAVAELSGETLAIDFDQCPSIRLVALFTFQLSVKRIEIRRESVRLIFSGSRLVKERTFKVE